MRKLRLLATLILSLSLLACAKSELHDAMEEMGGAFKSMNKTESLETIKADLVTFQGAFEIAKQQPVASEDQATFDEGMEKVEELAGQLAVAVDAGDLAAAKTLIAELRDANKKYHDKLGVE